MQYLLIESQSTWDSGSVAYFYGLAADLAAGGNEVTLYLVQNGVMTARSGAQDGRLASVARTVRVLADDFSLRERAIGPEALIAGVACSPIDAVVALLAGGAKTLWH
jgi:hypothetical protein